MSLTAILAISDDHVIGIEGPTGPKLPWRLPPDLQRFKELTTGHAIIMGRKTFDSIGRPLPNRHNVVVSRTGPHGYILDDLTWIDSPEEAVSIARKIDPSPYVIGGAQIYEALWPYVTRIELTEVRAEVGLGTCFLFPRSQWLVTYESDEREYEGLRYQFKTLEKSS